jgi:predicted RNase H-like HicB family nuclease
MNPCPIVIALVVNEERISMKRDFYVVVEKDEDGFFVGEVPQLRACYAQGKTMDELLANIREVIALCLEDEPEAIEEMPEFVGLQKVAL